MVSPTEVKKQVKKQVLDAIDVGKQINRDNLIAELSLNTGFKEATIEHLLQQMEQLRYITVKDGIITRPIIKSVDGAEQ